MGTVIDTSVRTTRDDGLIQIEIVGLESVSKALGDLQGKTPAAVKVAINQTARQARKELIASAKAYYAVNAKGYERLKQIKQKKKATNTSLYAELFSSQMRADLSYFQHSPTQAWSGQDVFRHSPAFYKARKLLKESMGNLESGTSTKYGAVSKGFLVEFKNGHIGMVQRDIGSSSSRSTTEKSGAPRWRNSQGLVEKLVTMDAPSGTAMLKSSWPYVQEDVELYLMARLQDRVDWILNRAVMRKAS